MLHPIGVASLALAVCGSWAAGQEDEGPAAARDPWTIKFEPAAWYVALNGSMRMPGETSNGDTFTAADLNADSPRVSPFGELQLRRGEWRIAVKGVGFSTDDRGAIATEEGEIGDIAVGEGDTLSTSFDLITFAVDGAYALHRAELGELPGGGVRVRSTVLALAGLRALDVSIDTSVFPVGSSGPLGTAGGEALHAHPYAGVRWELELHEDFTVDVAGAVGGFTMGDSESWSGDILVGFQWNPTPHLGAQVGYRQLLLGVEDGEGPGEFTWQGGLAGLYGGLTLRF